MKKRFLKLALLAAVVTTGSLATAPKAEARIMPATDYGQCIGGTYDVISYGWFGTVRSIETFSC